MQFLSLYDTYLSVWDGVLAWSWRYRQFVDHSFKQGMTHDSYRHNTCALIHSLHSFTFSDYSSVPCYPLIQILGTNLRVLLEHVTFCSQFWIQKFTQDLNHPRNSFQILVNEIFYTTLIGWEKSRDLTRPQEVAGWRPCEMGLFRALWEFLFPSRDLFINELYTCGISKWNYYSFFALHWCFLFL